MKKILFITSAILILSSINSNVYADNYAEAQSYIKKAKTASIEEQSYDYLNKARKLLEKDYETDKTNIKLLMSLSEVFQLIGDRREAKLFILQAYNIAPSDMYVQRAMGDFYYNFQEYTTALEYYKLSLLTGLLQDSETNMKVAECYEKLGDTQNAEVYYQVVNFINPDSQAAQNKINEYSSKKRPNNTEKLENAKYKYLFKDKPKSKEEKTKDEMDKIITQINQAF